MSSAMMMERPGTAFPGMGVPGYQTPPAPTGMAAGTNWMMVPRCMIRMEKMSGGFKMTCSCDDKLATSMVQNLCTMLQGGMASCAVMYNGMPCCTCHFVMGMCRCEPTDSGVSLMCTSGDQHCSEMLQACCDCITVMLEAGCTCCFLINHTPICCGTTEHSRSPSKAKSK
jgi:hypothetical protein